MPPRISAHAHRVVHAVRPRLRGRSHLVAFVLAVPAAVALTAVAAPGRARLAAAVFGFSMVCMFGASALLHLRRWSLPTAERLLRLDHTAIYGAIAGTATPIALLGLRGAWSTALLVVSWGGAALGALLEWAPFRNPRGMAHTLYLLMGWAPIAATPRLLDHVGGGVVALLLAGGALYTAGAVIVARRRPDPAPHVFGYHELWHALVIGAVVLHYAMVGLLVTPAGAPTA